VAVTSAAQGEPRASCDELAGKAGAGLMYVETRPKSQPSLHRVPPEHRKSPFRVLTHFFPPLLKLAVTVIVPLSVTVHVLVPLHPHRSNRRISRRARAPALRLVKTGHLP
jgi:hypothetical protein